MTLSAAQHEIRKGRIGSSLITAISGLNPFRQEFEAWLEITGRKPWEPMTDAQQEGHEFEDVIGLVAARKLGIVAWRNTDNTYTLDDFAAATPDFFAHSGPQEPGIAVAATGVLECKRVGFRVMHHWSDGLPVYVYTQAQWQLAVLRLADGYVGATVGGLPVETHVVPYDADFCAGLMEIAREWHQKHVVLDEPPQMDGSKAARDYIVRAYGKVGGEVKEASATVAGLMAKRREIALTLATAKSEAKLIDNQLLDFIGGDKGIKHDGEFVTRTVVNPKKGNPYVRLNLPKAWKSAEED